MDYISAYYVTDGRIDEPYSAAIPLRLVGLISIPCQLASTDVTLM